jgi:hypothetical protein
MKKVVRLTENDLANIIKKVISEQQSQSKFPFAFDNKTTSFGGEITKDGYLIVKTEMGHEYKIGPIEGVPFVGGANIQIRKGQGVEKVFVAGKSGKSGELKFKPNFTTRKIK